MLLAFAPGTDLSALWKAYIHGHYRRHPKTGQQVWVDSYSDKRPEKHRAEFAHWQHRIEHVKDHLAQGHTREALHAFHDLGHDDSHKLARDLGLHDDGPDFADKKTLMGAIHGRLLAKKHDLQAQVGRQVKADFEKRKAAGTVGKKGGKQPEAGQYQLPPGGASEDWRGHVGTDFQPTARQRRVMDAVGAALDAGKEYSKDIEEHVAQALHVSPADRQVNIDKVRGGEFGYDLHYARQAVETVRAGQANQRLAQEAQFRPGDKLGVLMTNLGKVITGARVEAVVDEKNTWTKIVGTQGNRAVTITLDAQSIQQSIDRAKASGRRPEGYAAFIAKRRQGGAPAVEAGDSQDLFAPPTPKAPRTPHELIAEHEKLIAVLKSPDHGDDLKEAKEQEAELKEYKGEAGGDAKAAKPKATPPDAADLSPAEIADAELQYQEVKARYQGTPGWLKAPNGQPSKLNERQWVLVRTPNFKRWFGNWAYNPDDPVPVVNVDPGAMAGINLEDTDAVRTWLLGAADFAEPALNADSGLAIGFSRGNLRASLKRRGGAHRQAYTALRTIIETARWTDYETSDRPGLAGQDVYHGALRMPNGALYGVRIKTDVRHDRSTAYKDHRLSEMVTQIQITPAASQGSREGIGYPGTTGPAQSGVTVSLGDVYGSGKPMTSAMVDANGEPLIVYHGTGADISGFDDQGKSTQGEGLGTGLGHFFATSKNYASDYAKVAQGNVMPTWLVIKRPLVITDREGMSAAFRIASDAYCQQRYGKTLYELENSEDDADYRTAKAFYDRHLGATDEGYFGRKNRFVRQQLQAMGYDGIVFKNDRQLDADGGEVLVAFTAPQVKSAIGNAGTFRPDLAHLAKAWPRTPIFFRHGRAH